MLLLLFACAIPDDPAALYGLWANVDDQDFARVWDMAEAHEETAELSPAYLIYHYELGLDPVLVQAGRYDLIVAWRGDSFELEVDKSTGDTRVYERVDELP